MAFICQCVQCFGCLIIILCFLLGLGLLVARFLGSTMHVDDECDPSEESRLEDWTVKAVSRREAGSLVAMVRDGKSESAARCVPFRHRLARRRGSA